MTFPVEFNLFGSQVPAHLIMELTGYAVGSQVFFLLRRRFPGPALGDERGLWIIVGCLIGAVVGSRLLATLESIHAYWPLHHDPRLFFGGKTIVGGLAGGWVGVEIAKRISGLRQSTGDRFVFPILIGLSIGRVGCFLEGLPDHTYGNFTNLPWGVDFGDGRRHPTQLYEIAFCLLLGIALLIRMRKPWRQGDLFKMLMLGYFSWRFAVEFIKPRETYFGLSPIQMTSLAGAAICAYLLRKSSKKGLAIPAGNVSVRTT